MLLLEGETVAGYYRGVFESDWAAASGGDPRSLPVGSILAVAGIVVLAVLVARRVEFGETTGVGPG